LHSSRGLLTRTQILELAVHLSRSIPASADGSAARDFVAGFEAQVKGEEGEEVPEETRKAAVKSLIGKFGELRGGLEAAKESGA
jgi:translation initiation factor 3 subunit M